MVDEDDLNRMEVQFREGAWERLICALPLVGHSMNAAIEGSGFAMFTCKRCGMNFFLKDDNQIFEVDD